MSTSSVSERTYLKMVFAWMVLGLAITAGVAEYIEKTSNVVQYFSTHTGIIFLLFAVQLGLVFLIGSAVSRMSVPVVATMFCVYSALVGITFSGILAVYTTYSLVSAFAGAVGVFGGMAAWGFFTNRELSGWGHILFGAIWGFIAASVVFLLTGGQAFNLVLGCIGVLLFSAFTAYDMQKIRRIAQHGIGDAATEEKLAIYGALQLYLDFLNLFISLLRIFGNAR